MSYQCCSVHICEPHQIFIKYNFKGGDHDMVSLGVPEKYGQPSPPRDEIITEFEDLQSCGTTEDCWRLYGFKTTMIYPKVQRLDVNLENQNKVVLQ
jgi:hypothetical protein